MCVYVSVCVCVSVFAGVCVQECECVCTCVVAEPGGDKRGESNVVLICVRTFVLCCGILALKNVTDQRPPSLPPSQRRMTMKVMVPGIRIPAARSSTGVAVLCAGLVAVVLGANLTMGRGTWTANEVASEEASGAVFLGAVIRCLPVLIVLLATIATAGMLTRRPDTS